MLNQRLGLKGSDGCDRMNPTGSAGQPTEWPRARPVSFSQTPGRDRKGEGGGHELALFSCSPRVASSIFSIFFPSHQSLAEVFDSSRLSCLGLKMEHLMRAFHIEPSASENLLADQEIQRCPFLRNINEPTNFSFSSNANFPLPVRGAKGPIFEDGPNFDMAFRLFHGRDGVVPLTRRSSALNENPEPEPSLQFNPLAAKAASISLSAFGPGGPFGFDFFSNKWKKLKNSSKKESSSQRGSSSHESLSNEWLETGQCPIAKSYRAVSGVLPLVAKALQPPPGVKLRCPPAVVAARAALARTAFVKNLRPQPLSAKMLAITLLGISANIPLGVWREHTKKFSPQWFAAVHAAVPFIAMLRKSVLMPKTAMAVTLAASILGQTIGSRAERNRLKAVAASAKDSSGKAVAASAKDTGKSATVISLSRSGNCSGEGRAWDPLPIRAITVGSSATEEPTGNVCF